MARFDQVTPFLTLTCYGKVEKNLRAHKMMRCFVSCYWSSMLLDIDPDDAQFQQIYPMTAWLPALGFTGMTSRLRPGNGRWLCCWCLRTNSSPTTPRTPIYQSFRQGDDLLRLLPQLRTQEWVSGAVEDGG